MGSVFGVFFRGLLGVLVVCAVVAVMWSTYLKRESLASALAPAASLVERLRGVSSAPPDPPPPVERETSAEGASGASAGASSPSGAPPSAPAQAPAAPGPEQPATAN